MTDYTKTTNFAAKDTLASGNAAKIISGTEIDAEFVAIRTAVNSKANSANASLTGTTQIDTADINGGAIDAVTIGATTPATSVSVDNINIDGNTISSTDTVGDGNIAITPNGTGEVDISKVDIDGGAIDGTIIGANSAVAVTGTTITANTQFTGSGAGLTSIPSGQLTGALPAIDGSSLTGIGLTQATQALSGISTHTFSSIPSNAKEIYIMFTDVTNNYEPLIRLGHSGGTFIATNYKAHITHRNTDFERLSINRSTNGFLVGKEMDSNAFFTGTYKLINAFSNNWHLSGQGVVYEKNASGNPVTIPDENTQNYFTESSGFVDVTATLDAIKIKNSSDANWSGGNVSIAYRV